MTLTQLRTMAYASLPALKQKTVDNTTIDLYLNKAVIDIAAYTCCLKTNKKFAVVADTNEYNLSTVLGDYLAMDKPGLYWNAGTATSTNYDKLDSETLESLDRTRPNWRDLSSDSPEAYSIDGDILTVVPAPESSLTDGFWIYYGKKPTNMTAINHYPFSGSTTEYTHLTIFDDALILYVRAHLNPTLNKLTDENLTMKAYIAEREEKFRLFSRRRDIAASRDARFRGPRVRK